MKRNAILVAERQVDSKINVARCLVAEVIRWLDGDEDALEMDKSIAADWLMIADRLLFEASNGLLGASLSRTVEPSEEPDQ